MNKYFVFGGIILVVGIAIFLIVNSPSSSSNGDTYTAFTQCIAASGAKFYGAYWCPHCNDQKDLFGDAKDELPYVECALPGNPNTMTQECKDAGIEGYPTWIFADESRLSGTQSLETLAEKTACALPDAS